MTAYRITSSAGVDLGTYEADDAAAALDAMARDAGCADAAEAAATAGAFEGTIVETEESLRKGGRCIVSEELYRTKGWVMRAWFGTRGDWDVEGG